MESEAGPRLRLSPLGTGLFKRSTGLAAALIPFSRRDKQTCAHFGQSTEEA